MKISFLINSLDMGGAENVLLTYVQALSRLGLYDISVITNKPSASKIQAKMEEYANCHSIFSLYEYNNTNPIIKVYKSIKRRIMLHLFLKKTDVIIDFLDCDFDRYIKSFKQKKITYLHSSFQHLMRRKKNIVERCNIYDAIITICQDMHAEIHSFSPQWIDKAHIIYNPFNFEDLKNSSIDYSLLTESTLNILNGEYILTVCRLNEETKDIATLLDAYYLARKQGCNQDLVIIGDGPDKVNLEQKATVLNLEKHVIFIGECENPYVWMKHAKKFVLSSKDEGFGLVIVEALYLNGNVISSDCYIGPSEILQRGMLGELFDVGNKQDLSNLLNQPSTRMPLQDGQLDIYRADNSVLMLHKLISGISNAIN